MNSKYISDSILHLLFSFNLIQVQFRVDDILGNRIIAFINEDSGTVEAGEYEIVFNGRPEPACSLRGKAKDRQTESGIWNLFL